MKREIYVTPKIKVTTFSHEEDIVTASNLGGTLSGYDHNGDVPINEGSFNEMFGQ